MFFANPGLTHYMIQTFPFAYSVVFKSKRFKKAFKKRIKVFNFQEKEFWLIALIGSDHGTIQDSSGNTLRVNIARRLIIRKDRRCPIKDLISKPAVRIAV